jgi:uncharacterized iron-regulated membrane protein
MGILFGIANQLLALAAIGLITIVVRGYLMWWQRRSTRGAACAAGRSSLRGALRQLSPFALAAVIVAAIVVGWLLPLLGVSLLAVLLIGTAIAAIKRLRSQAKTPEGQTH